MDVLNRFCVIIEGVNVPIFFSEECFRSALNFKPKKGDIIIVTYPKCGTTWMQNLVLNILRKGEPFEKPSDFYFASPFLDQLGAEDSEKIMIRPGCYKTHLPLHKILLSDDAKYIYVARNPKDCCVSYYHHMKSLPGYQFADGTFEEFFDLFIKGEVESGNYLDHLLPWYNMRNRPNVFFTTYEKMKSDLKSVAMDIAAFIDKKNQNIFVIIRMSWNEYCITAASKR
ncbi:sulfotransferase 1C4 [Caerostris darwini]|uniref:Sulfotransferase 1C4 n=1 Tax=Caerostris darwini TaxID=1538125 RepID=A0AAV4WL13_9ARAC|nr:sulfotransferase 1C4 [Caerostris darwini]